ncbi:CPBP family intramembrane glutamic endopeptidase [Pelagovum pacificum]|uniref:CPBP family intramembrane metalloprotease n=1 Tax=Pelagovum pacificum TaxID=2588711 RepID=A0A5C5GK87_9RHOB|nr:type II CAAX endopeptidase family protein [Pelagovum pacificum]QQA42628.1 CPBP family intramembrane metalloprotease [Pelagovum pacificum]TNY34221.1 CPBP family intramembrane metalloprotease [Pelagovum pacificum]
MRTSDPLVDPPVYPEISALRGLALIGVTVTGFVVFVATLVTASTFGALPNDWIALVRSAPLRVGGAETPDALRQSAHQLILLMLLSGPVLWLLFLAAHRVVLGFSALRWLGEGRAFRRDLLTALAIVAPPFAGVAVWQITSGAVDPLAGFAAAPFAALAIFLLLPAQTLIEEIVFRGFLQRWLAGITPTTFLVATLIQSSLFGLLHEHWSYAFAVGVITTMLTYRTGNLAAAWAFHLTNNFYVTLVGFGTGAPARIIPEPFDFPIGQAIGLWMIVAVGVVVRLRVGAEAAACLPVGSRRRRASLPG